MQHGTIGWFVFATLLLALGMTPPAAAVDLSGDYVVTIPIPCRVTVVQTGTALQTTGSCDFGGAPTPYSASGTVNPVTGAFSGTSDLGGVCSGVISGTGDGEVLIATTTSTCYSGPISATKCSNGVIDPLENCEDGNAIDGDCCSARCRLDPAGTGCTSDWNDCTDDVCNATGTCTHVSITRSCEDGNACTIGDVCAAGVCVPGSPAPTGHACDDDSDPCTTDVCDATGMCTHVPLTGCRRDIARCMATQCAGVGPEACRRRCKPAAIRTLAYVLSECRGNAARGVVWRQALHIRRGDREPITIVEFGPSEATGQALGPSSVQFGDGTRWGAKSVFGFPLQRLGVSPDGSGVVFEVNDEFSISGFTVSPEQEGMFFVRSNGRGLRRLGPPSHEQSFRTSFALPPPLSFSPNGRRIAFTDRGPGPRGEPAAQIVVLDLATGEPTQVTHLPSGTPPSTVFGDFFLTCCPTFIDDETILFETFTDPVGSNPEHNFAAFTVRIDGTNFKPVPAPAALPGSQVVPTFGLTGRRTNLVRLTVPGTPVSPPTMPPTFFPITEVFVQDGKNLLQLTNFRRTDTFIGFLSPTSTRAFFMGSADPLGKNANENCQMFSIDTSGGGLRQVTHFNPGGGQVPIPGCFGPHPPWCSVGAGYYRVVFQDPVTKAVVFESSCDPLGANPNGGQIFAMRPDGFGLRQLTDAAGITTNPDRSITVELPGPFAYSAALH
jgi:cysteine-rich repeat protein